MANHKGSEGVVKAGGSAVAEVRSWEITQTGETIEDTALGDAARTFRPGNTGWSGSLSCWWDETDAPMQTLDAGAEVTLALYPEGTASLATYFTGSAIITSVKRSAAVNGIVQADFAFTGNGALSETAV